MTFRFGLASEIDVDVATGAFCGTVLFLVVFEYITSRFEKFIGGSVTYNKMLQRIYKELMNNGFVSFTLAMYQATHPKASSSSWINIFDFVGYIIFFIAIFFVAHALYIMLLSILSSHQYDRYHAIAISDLLKELAKPRNIFSSFLYNFRYLPFSTLRTKAEFKIIYALFRDTYWLPGDFNYGLYLSGCFEKYSLRIINISNFSWGVLIILCLVNYIRVKFGQASFWNCEGFKHTDGTEDSGRYGITDRCTFMHLQLFFVCGMALSGYALIVYTMGRVYVMRLMAQSGVTDIIDYVDFLALEESTSLNVELRRRIEIDISADGTDGNPKRSNSMRGRTASRRMSINTLRSNIDKMSSIDDAPILHKQSTNVTNDDFTDRIGSAISFIGSLFASEKQNKKEDSMKAPALRHKRRSNVVSAMESSETSANDLDTSGNDRRKSVTITLGGGPLGRTPSSGRLATENSLNTIEQFKLQKLKRDSSRGSGFMSGIRSLINSGQRVLPDHADISMKISEDYSHIYFLNDPTIYFRAVEVGITLNSLYLSLWVTNFISTVSAETTNTVLWHILMMCPLIIILPVVGEIVKTASMLSAIAELEVDVMGSVLEQMEDQQQLLQQLQVTAKNRINASGPAAKEIITALFNTIDVNGSGSLNHYEVREFLRALHLHYSNDKFRRLFKAIDVNKDGSISCDELYKLICPEDAEVEEIKARTEAVQLIRSQSQHQKNQLQASPSRGTSFRSFIPRLSTSFEHKSSSVIPEETSLEDGCTRPPESTVDLSEDVKTSPTSVNFLSRSSRMFSRLLSGGSDNSVDVFLRTHGGEVQQNSDGVVHMHSSMTSNTHARSPLLAAECSEDAHVTLSDRPPEETILTPPDLSIPRKSSNDRVMEFDGSSSGSVNLNEDDEDIV